MEGENEMKCFSCNKWEKTETFYKCKELLPNMDMECLLRHFIWMQMARAGLLEKTEKMMDNINKEMKGGEEWKNETP